MYTIDARLAFSHLYSQLFVHPYYVHDTHTHTNLSWQFKGLSIFKTLDGHFVLFDGGCNLFLWRAPRAMTNKILGYDKFSESSSPRKAKNWKTFFKRVKVLKESFLSSSVDLKEGQNIHKIASNSYCLMFKLFRNIGP